MGGDRAAAARTGKFSGRWRDYRQVINGILWKLRTGAPWRDLPERFGPWKTCHERLRGWTANGTWIGPWPRAQVHDDDTPVQQTISIDSLQALAWLVRGPG
ncbi:transposase [Micromonospora purpureochromogenes]|uniref:Transposase n=1 Tax=Micromonospora purpureochromogenes TaxID=47872 RepID=A0ABX2RWU2_9ACTN|nr:transposase [Micromonospora purpureochromogenes]